MFMRSNLAILLAGAFTASAWAQALDPATSLKINLPADSPLAVVSTDLGDSRATPRGGAMALDLRVALTLRNLTQNRVRGVTLLVLAQDVTPGGKASVATPSLNVGPGEAFPVRIDLRLLRPLSAAMTGPLVRVDLDGVLFQDLSFYGPNLLNSRRSMTVWEAEAERDRRHFRSILAAQGPDGLQREVLDSLARQAARPRLDVQVSRGGRSTSTAASGAGHVAQFAFLKFPDSPVEPIEGAVRIAGNEARSPSIQVRNRSAKPVSYFEIGWIVRDKDGREYLAASVPATEAELRLAPGQQGRALQDAALRFSRNGGPVSIEGMTGFVSQVEYADGKVWVPNRSELSGAQLMRVLAPSPEEQRLTDFYRRKGLAALVLELRKY